MNLSFSGRVHSIKTTFHGANPLHTESDPQNKSHSLTNGVGPKSPTKARLRLISDVWGADSSKIIGHDSTAYIDNWKAKKSLPSEKQKLAMNEQRSHLLEQIEEKRLFKEEEKLRMLREDEELECRVRADLAGMGADGASPKKTRIRKNENAHPESMTHTGSDLKGPITSPNGSPGRSVSLRGPANSTVRESRGGVVQSPRHYESTASPRDQMKHQSPHIPLRGQTNTQTVDAYPSLSHARPHANANAAHYYESGVHMNGYGELSSELPLQSSSQVQQYSSHPQPHLHTDYNHSRLPAVPELAYKVPGFVTAPTRPTVVPHSVISDRLGYSSHTLQSAFPLPTLSSAQHSVSAVHLHHGVGVGTELASSQYPHPQAYTYAQVPRIGQTAPHGANMRLLEASMDDPDSFLIRWQQRHGYSTKRGNTPQGNSSTNVSSSSSSRHLIGVSSSASGIQRLFASR